MKITRAQVKEYVITGLRELIKPGSDYKITEITKPISHLGLDSQDGIIYACVLSDKLNWRIPNEVNPLVNDGLHQERSVGQIIDFLIDNIDKRRN